MRWVLVFLTVSAALTAGAFAALWLLGGGEGVGLSLHGGLALTLGIVLTAAMTVGLMALMFHSDRSGHDAEVGSGHPDERRRE